MTSSAQIVAAARAFLGVPWQHRGRDARGMDCAGLVIAVAERLGLPHPPPFDYDPLPDLRLFNLLLRDYCRRVVDPEPGDVLHFNVAGRPQHVALCAAHPDGGLSIIHALPHVGRVCEHRLDARWQRRLIGAWRMRGVA